MDKNEYSKLSKIGSVPIKGMELCLNEMLNKGIILKDYTVAELIVLCEEYSEMELKVYEDNKLEQNYGKVE